MKNLKILLDFPEGQGDEGGDHHNRHLQVPALLEAMPLEFFNILVPTALEREEKKEAKKEQAILDGVAAIAHVMQISARTWREIRDRLQERKTLTEKEAGILGVVTKEPQGFPSEKQAAILVRVLERGQNEGIKIERNTR